MKCRHGHRWIEDRCVMGWCKQDKEGVDVVERHVVRTQVQWAVETQDPQPFIVSPEFDEWWERERERMMRQARRAQSGYGIRRQ